MGSVQGKAVLLFSCQDQKGLVAKIAGLIHEQGGNILDLDEHVDPESRIFFIRVSCEFPAVCTEAEELRASFAALAKAFGATWSMHSSEERQRLAIFVSRYDHCIQELLWRHRIGEIAADIALVVSNHPDLEPLAMQYGIPFYCFPVTPETKVEQEQKELELLAREHIDVVVLARYMQVLTERFVQAYPHRIINIHHSFLPAFSGGNPYRQAFQRGVKIIGATSHYVTELLDDGPIIQQDIIRISHRDSPKDLAQKGRDLERMVLARAVLWHIEHRVLVNGRKTVIFE